MNNILKAGLCATLAITSACSIQSIESEYDFESDTGFNQNQNSIEMKKASFKDEKVSMDLEKNQNSTIKKATRMVYKRAVPSNIALARMPVSISDKNISLLRALTIPFENMNVSPSDEYVDLDLKLHLFANNMPFENYLRHIEAISGYGITYKDGTINVQGNSTERINISAIQDNIESKASILETASKTIDTTRKGSFVGLIDNDSKLLISGLPGEVTRAKNIIENTVYEAMKQVSVSVSIIAKNYGGSEELYTANALVRNSKQSILASTNTFNISGSIESSKGRSEPIDVGLSFYVKPVIANNNKLIVKLTPVVDSLINKHGQQALNPMDLNKVKLGLKHLETEVVMNSGQTIEVGSSISAILQDGYKIPVSMKDDSRNILFDNNHKGSDMKEFKVLLNAFVAESK